MRWSLANAARRVTVLRQHNSLNTDIIFGHEAGIATMLVKTGTCSAPFIMSFGLPLQTGIHTVADAEHADVKPNYILNCVADLNIINK